jgi:tRNA 2-thiocytidine biosynthesis protein TtcA
MLETVIPKAIDYQKLEKKIFNKVGTAIADFKMIDESDRILVAVSGGKDSWVLLHVLNDLKKRAPIDFDLVVVNIDQGYAGFRQDLIDDFLAAKDIKRDMQYFDIATLLDEKMKDGSVPCSLCARLRRGALAGAAQKLNCNKIALGHHLDDFIETLLLNEFFTGRVATMAPVLQPEESSARVIRPLVYVSESDIIAFAKNEGFPIVCCQCPLMCGENTHIDHKRRYIKTLLKNLEKDIPDIKNSLISSMSRVQPSHLLDRELWNFTKMEKN